MYHHGNLKQTLLNLALDALEKEGLENLSLREIALSAGVSKTAPYRHFENKTQLLVEIAAEGFSILANALESASQSGGDLHPREALAALKPILKAYVDFARNHPEVYKLMFSRIGYGLHSERCRINSDRAMEILRLAVENAQIKGWKSRIKTVGLVLTLWALVHGWAGMFIENLLPPGVPFNMEDWLDSVGEFMA